MGYVLDLVDKIRIAQVVLVVTVNLVSTAIEFEARANYTMVWEHVLK